jgi:SAM-dependent methyltransferase
LTVEPGAQPSWSAEVETLRAQRRAWESRPLLRRLYRESFEQIVRRLSPVAGPTVEIGAGCGAFRDFLPEVVTTDAFETPWADRVADAQDLPFESGEVANLVMVDILHHAQRPAAALREAQRVLAPGGRLIMVEPYCAPLSTLGYRRFHHEPLDFDVDPESPIAHSSEDPFDANIALATLIFWRRPESVSRWAPAMRVSERSRFGWLAYPLSGGFTGTRLLPRPLWRPALALDGLLNRYLAPLAAFRCLVVVEKTAA